MESKSEDISTRIQKGILVSKLVVQQLHTTYRQREREDDILVAVPLVLLFLFCGEQEGAKEREARKAQINLRFHVM